jgi:hypothetical protein
MRIFNCCATAISRLAVEKRWSTVCLFAILALLPPPALSAETSPVRRYGDPAARTAIDIQLKRIYELTAGPGQQLELLTKDNPLQLRDALVTEVTASLVDGSISRIVGTVWTKQGKYSFEFYRAGGKLLMVYETLAYFPDSAPPDAWYNFMGLPAWESRTYFNDKEEVAFAENHGPQAPAPDHTGGKFREMVDRVVHMLDRSSTRWERR